MRLWSGKRRSEAAAQMADGSAADAGLPQLNEAFPHLELEPVESAGEDANTTAGREAGATQDEAGATRPEVVAEDATEAGAGDEPAGEAAVEAGNGAGAEAKRAAKLREREARVTIKQVLDELIAEYAADGRGIEIREIAGGYRMATKPQCHDAVRLFVKSLKPALKLSLPALETLAVIAYKQPVTAPEVNEIRGVDSSGVFGSLLARKLIVTAGRKPVVGRPILYKTTREFLLRFGLKDVTELPSMEEFEKMAASELDEMASEAGDETAAAAEFDPDLSAETEEAASEEAAETNTHEDAQEKEETAGGAE